MGISAVEAFREEGRVEGRVEGREEGRVEGREEYREEVATNMLKKGRTLEEVVELADLSQEQIETILRKINGESKC